MIQFLPLVKTFWGQSKWLILGSVLVASHWYAMEYGAKRELRKLVADVPAQVQKERDKGKEAVERATTSTQRLGLLEKENEDLRKQIDALPDRLVCKPSADELRILEDIQGSTAK